MTSNTINNQNQLSAADPSSSQVAARRKRAKGRSGDSKDSRVFKSNLDDELSKKGGIVGAQALGTSQPARTTPHKSIDAAQLDATGEKDPFNPIAQSMNEAGRVGSPQLTVREVSSANTGSQFAGLKPWDQNWVFEGKPKPAAEVHPLFGKSTSELELAGAKKALAQLATALAAEQAHSGPHSKAIPEATQVSRNLRARGGKDIQTDPAARMRLAEQLGALYGNVEEVNVNGGPNGRLAIRKNGAQGAQPGNRVAASGLSGAEFMKTLSIVRPQLVQAAGQAAQVSPRPSGAQEALPQFRIIGEATGGRKDGQDAQDFTAAALRGPVMGLHGLSAPSHSRIDHPAVQLTGHVVQGSMARNQLTHEVILGMTNGIHSMSANGGGEMRIRLKPDNLGELRLRISAKGNEVGLQIQASDEKARKVLEDSLNSLKDSLASQNLTLASVAINVAKAGASHGMHNDPGNGNPGQGSYQQQYGQALGQNAGDRNQRFASSWSDPGGGRAGARSVRSNGLQASGAVSALRSDPLSTDGRLDVMA